MKSYNDIPFLLFTTKSIISIKYIRGSDIGFIFEQR